MHHLIGPTAQLGLCHGDEPISPGCEREMREQDVHSDVCRPEYTTELKMGHVAEHSQ
jgi:hypothetical protein